MDGQRRSGRMAASYNDPWISVGLLAQNIFCHRAGIIHRENPQDWGEEEIYSAGRGRRRTFYSFYQLGKSIKKTAFILAIEVILWITVTIIASSNQAPPDPFSTVFYVIKDSACLVYPALIILFLMGLFRLLYLCFIYTFAKLSRPVEPDPQATEGQPIYWWGLLNAGFQVTKPQDIYRDEQWHLTGCPWRVLVKGNMRIPVFKKRFSDNESGKILHRQHYARMAAYCHLIEKCENAYSPYGIILYGNTHRGTTVPYQIRSKKTFHSGLLETRAAIRTHESTPYYMPALPNSWGKCGNCPHSRKDRMTGASACGTRFSWMPPNNRDAYLFRW